MITTSGGEASLSYARSNGQSACLLRKLLIADAKDTPLCNAHIGLDIGGYHYKGNAQKRHCSKFLLNAPQA